MFIKIVRNGHESLYPVAPGALDYGTRYLYDHPTNPQRQDWWQELQTLNNAPYSMFLVATEEAAPTGYRNFIDPENHPDEQGQPWWMVRWVAYNQDIPRGNDTESLRTLLVTTGEVFILGDNGKTIDRVKA